MNNPDVKPHVAWVYTLSKEQLREELTRRRVDAGGLLASLRQRMVGYVRAHPDEFVDKPEDGPDFNEELDISRDIESELEVARAAIHSTPIRDVTRPDTTKVLEQMRKWNCHFDGKDFYAFIERIEELQQAYALTDDQVLKGFPELLRGDAQLWFRNFQTEYRTLEELKNGLRTYYLSPGELRHLDAQIHERKQGASEKIRSFITAVMTLMRRRGGFSQERQLDIIYYNMQAKYRLHITRDSVRHISGLAQRVEELDETMKQVAGASSHRTEDDKPAGKKRTSVAAAYDRSTACWRCKQNGHSRTRCRNAQRKFCSYCGTDGRYSRDCPCAKPGNADGAGGKEEADRPKAE